MMAGMVGRMMRGMVATVRRLVVRGVMVARVVRAVAALVVRGMVRPLGARVMMRGVMVMQLVFGGAVLGVVPRVVLVAPRSVAMRGAVMRRVMVAVPRLRHDRAYSAALSSPSSSPMPTPLMV